VVNGHAHWCRLCAAGANADIGGVSGALRFSWLVENPGRQLLTGSFHPVTDSNWFDQAYSNDDPSTAAASQFAAGSLSASDQEESLTPSVPKLPHMRVEPASPVSDAAWRGQNLFFDSVPAPSSIFIDEIPQVQIRRDDLYFVSAPERVQHEQPSYHNPPNAGYYCYIGNDPEQLSRVQKSSIATAKVSKHAKRKVEFDLGLPPATGFNDATERNALREKVLGNSSFCRVCAHQFAAMSSDDTAQSAVSKMFLLVSSLYRDERISKNERDALKELILTQDRRIRGIYECFEIDHDIDELLENVHILAQLWLAG
jgi:hypothetical protein